MRDSFADKYRQYLRSDKWHVIRKKRLEFDSGECVACGKKAANVHHKRYPKVWGTESIKDLASMCRECHKKEHGHDALKFDEDTMVAYTVHNQNVEIIGASNSMEGIMELCDKCGDVSVTVGTRSFYNRFIIEKSKEGQ